MSFFFLKKHSKYWKNWTLLGYQSRDCPFFFVENMTQRIELFFLAQFDSKNCSFFFSWFKYLDLFHMTQRIEPSFLRDSNTWTCLKNFDSKKWTLFFQDSKFFHQEKTHRIEFFESDPQNWIFLWIEPFNFLYDAKIWTLFFKISLKELIFLKRVKELNSFWEDDSKNWTLFGSMPQRI